MISIRPRLRWFLWAASFTLLIGCQDSESSDESSSIALPTTLVPVSGLVTANGKPLPKAVVTFLPPSGPGVGTGETDKDGKYTLSSLGRPGIPPGEFKVAVSYLVSAEGQPQGLGPRNSQVQGAGMLSAKEQLPPEYSDLGRTKLSAKVGPSGGNFDFAIPVALEVSNSAASEALGAKDQPASEKAGKRPRPHEKSP